MKYILFISFLLCTDMTVQAQLPSGIKDFDVAQGLGSSNPVYLTPFNGKLYFYGSNGLSGREPFYVQGSGNSVMIHNMNPGGKHSIGGTYFQPCAGMNSKFYFTAENGSSGEELFMYDGINIPTLVFDLTFGKDSSSPDNYVVIGSKLFFTATTASEGRELYEYNGVGAPSRLTDINSGPANSVSGPMVAHNNILYFVCTTPAEGAELWMYNPLTTTAQIVADIDTGASSSNPAGLAIHNNTLFFTATTFAHGRELYSYDFSNPPKRLTDISANGLSSITAVQKNAFGFYKSLMFFGARDTTGENHLWSYEQANGNIKLEYKINPTGDSGPRDFAVYNGRLYFTANDGINGYELFMYDGNNDPVLAADMCQGAGSGIPSELTVIGDELYFAANSCALSGIDLFSFNYKRVGIRNVLFDADVQVYPNPVQNILHIDIALKQNEQLGIRLADMSGRAVYDAGLQKYTTGKNNITIPLHNTMPGNYIYYVTNSEGRIFLTGNVVKQ